MKDEEKAKGQLLQELKELREKVTQMKESVVDELTRLYNRRHFFDLAQHEFLRARRFERPLSAIMIDTDGLNKINEDYGHAIGDQVLATVADRCRTNVRYVDILGRYGEEEFVILLPESDSETAGKIAERLRQSIAGTSVTTQGGPITTTVSIGVADINKDTPNLPALLDRTEKAMHVAKLEGGDNVEIG